MRSWPWGPPHGGISFLIRTGKPGVLQSMGSKRVGHDWATELNWRRGRSQSSFSLCTKGNGLKARKTALTKNLCSQLRDLRLPVSKTVRNNLLFKPLNPQYFVMAAWAKIILEDQKVSCKEAGKRFPVLWNIPFNCLAKCIPTCCV